MTIEFGRLIGKALDHIDKSSKGKEDETWRLLQEATGNKDRQSVSNLSLDLDKIAERARSIFEYKTLILEKAKALGIDTIQIPLSEISGVWLVEKTPVSGEAKKGEPRRKTDIFLPDSTPKLLQHVVERDENKGWVYVTSGEVIDDILLPEKKKDKDARKRAGIKVSNTKEYEKVSIEADAKKFGYRTIGEVYGARLKSTSGRKKVMGGTNIIEMFLRISEV